ncbi:exo-beta-N-acetylmuramidase NamZ domain-containing protein [Bacillus altitudinis]|uniref:exo-beta-N-acetylmuramidase NamZ domain-containing protein n=1 Tax=Bacillus altitudinis TaxID=293387 RepID=UPI002353E963|nr:exo-beta-N-acetylmuramidase NamZ domain-containing protein [Bacillus altitudinis]
MSWVKGKKVGVIRNRTGIDGKMKRSVDVVFEEGDMKVSGLYGGEDGVGGDGQGGEGVEWNTDEKRGLREK